MVTSLSALGPKITNMVPSKSQRVENWRQWSLFTSQGRCAVTILQFHPNGTAPGQHMEKIFWQSSQMPIRRPFCQILKTCLLIDVKKVKYSYSLPEYRHNSTELVFPNLVNPLSVSSNKEMQEWYGQDWRNCKEEDNSDKTYVDVYTWYARLCLLETISSLI